ncbi:MAG: addiction module killer protein [Gammaproteobacteria bacterium RIFCSPLOWO2_12_47_11]|nr:MAG: addiction module killer protein [Gammaproteobacteria bacterium RIFCSPLOWO2_12_47_11]
MQEHYQIREYLTEDGRSPFSEWLNKLRDIRARARIRTRLDRVSLGNMGDYAAAGDGIYELRIFYGPGYRVYYGITENNTVVLLLCGGIKGSQQRDINMAKSYWNDFRSQR